MPSAYTSELCEKDVSFEKFVMRCARAFSACITMRDSDFDAPIPEKFVPSDYHVKAAAEAKVNIASLEAMTEGECEEAAIENYRKTKIEIRRANSKAAVVRDRLLSMRAKVADWKAPTRDHEELKRFMVRQIDETLEYEGRPLVLEIKKTSGLEWRSERLANERRSLKYHEKEYRKESERVEVDNRWLSRLRASLKITK